MPSRILSTHWRHGWNPSSLSQLRRTGWKLSFIYFQQKWGKKLTDSVILTRALLSWWKASVGDKTSSKEIKTTTKKTESANSSFVGNFRITHTRPFCNQLQKPSGLQTSRGLQLLNRPHSMGNGMRWAVQTQKAISDPDVDRTCTCCWHKHEDRWERPKPPAHSLSSGSSQLARLNLLCCSIGNTFYMRG